MSGRKHSNPAPARPPRWRLRLFGALRGLALRTSCASWRKRLDGLAALDELTARGEAPIVVFWHDKYIALLPLMRGSDACVFTSLSARGDAIADILQRFGYHAVQLQDSGGDASLELMRESLIDSNRAAAIAVDGPLGPRHLVHRGAVQLASALARPVVPIALAIRPRRVIATRWDRLELPRLFARVQLIVGEPITVPVGIVPDEIRYWCDRVGAELERLEHEAERRLTG